jgi:hypothetical protein
MRCKWKLPRAALIVGLLLGTSGASTFACSIIPPKRAPTVAEQMAGLSTIFGGTVVGWETDSGKKHMGQMPSACLEDGRYHWYANPMPATCRVYLDTSAALFRVDTPIVGPNTGEIIPVYMTWGDGDCNIDFDWGEQWFIAGDESEGKVYSDLLSEAAQQVIREPIRADEIAALRKMAAEPKFDFNTLYK